MELFEKKEQCCGCGACANICPKSAIKMLPDEYGYIYPVIDSKLCVECGLCKNVCGFKNNNFENSSIAYAAVSKDDTILKKSASGGVFGLLAREIISAGGKVYGCSMEYMDGELTPKHIGIDSVDEILKLQGSKYVQSDMGNCFQLVKEDLVNGKKVLFSGTPCQVASLNTFLDKKYENLLTVDLICHGVPAAEHFKSYLEHLGKGKNKVTGFRFRDKKSGWGYRAVINYSSGKTRSLPASLSSYFKLFSDATITRDSCYSCPFACTQRPADITVGDYWGIEKVHPDSLLSNGGNLNTRLGISCVLLNNDKGIDVFNKYIDRFITVSSDVDKVANYNSQLKHPSKKHVDRNVVLELYRSNGWAAVEKWYNKKLGLKKYKIKTKEFIKKCLGRI